jgi:putative transposon-encoded protein
MRRIPLNITNEIKINNIEGYLEKKVTKFGTGAKVDIPKEYLKKRVVILVCKD